MTNWNTLEEKFLDRFFPHHKFMEAKTTIAVFAQGSNETLCEAWERYKSMLRKCPNHGFDELTQIHIFRNGLLQQSKLLLDATAGGSLLSLSVADATAIIEKMALSDRQGEYNRNPSQRKPGILELDTSDDVLAQNKLLTNTVEELSKQMSKLISLQEGSSKAKQVAYCKLCTGDHPTGYCPPTNEEVNYMGNQPRQGKSNIKVTPATSSTKPKLQFGGECEQAHGDATATVLDIALSSSSASLCVASSSSTASAAASSTTSSSSSAPAASSKMQLQEQMMTPPEFQTNANWPGDMPHFTEKGRLNKATRKDHFPLPFMDQMLERLSGQEFYCFLDGYSGYNQIIVNPEDHEKTTFTCPFGVFAYRRMFFGLCNAPATFQRCMQAIFSDLIEKYIECHFMVTEAIVLGHKISSKGIEVDKAKVEVIMELPPPVNVKGIRSFLGQAGFY
ncbi:reverse transcriptase, partial [Trifolium medium]|nr:reverse transcriptase [Trifolium medium]